MSGKINTGKKIVLFADGTGNSSGSTAKTNVWRAYKALNKSPGSRQVAFYDGGVGTSAISPLKFIGLVFGWGLAKNVRQIYKFVCYSYQHAEHHEERDQIYGFGFSRGAFTMRVVMAMIASQGIIDVSQAKSEQDLERLIVAAYRDFRTRSFKPSMFSKIGRPLLAGWTRLVNMAIGRQAYDPAYNFEHEGNKHKDNHGTRDHSIRFMGVWDTVDAYGLPIDEMTRAWDSIIWPLSAKDRDLSPRVEAAAHALALDEQRESFEPMLWNEQLEDGEVDKRIIQVWFAGVHANIGGGYHDDSLAHVPLNWMIKESKKHGLAFNKDEEGKLKQGEDFNGPLFDNRAGAGNLYRYAPRKIEELCKSAKLSVHDRLQKLFKPSSGGINSVEIEKPKIHHTVFDRLKKNGGAYAPINLPADYAIVERNGTKTEISNPAKGAQLAETASQASTRRTRQTSIWVNVFKAKLWYYLMLLALGSFAVFPYFFSDWKAAKIVETIVSWIEPIFGPISGIVRSIPSLIGKIPLPGMEYVGMWTEKFDQFPYVFLVFILGIVAIFKWGRKARTRVNDEMRQNWAHVTGKSNSAAKIPGPVQVKRGKYLASDKYKNGVRTPLRMTLEIATMVLFFGAAVSLISQAVFIAVDGSGGTCVETTKTDLRAPIGSIEGEKPPQKITNFSLEGKNPCTNTGIILKAKTRYHLRWEIDSDWFDGEIEADTRGWFGKTPFKTYFAVLVRRHVLNRWYQPVAKIGDNLFDIHLLEHTRDALPDWVKPEMINRKKQPEKVKANAEADAEPKAVNNELDLYKECTMKLHEKTRRMVLCTIIEPRRSGELFLYVNDALFLTPFIPIKLLEFYSNNKGWANVTIVPVEE